MAKFIDKWITGDVLEGLKILRLTVTDDDGKPWGLSMGLGYVPRIEIRKAGTVTLFKSLTGAWADVDESQACFVIGTDYIPATGATSQDYEFLLVLTRNGKSTFLAADSLGTSWAFTVQRWP